MASSDLIIRVLADTSNATGNVNALVESLGKLAGVGAGAAVAGGFIGASMKVQDAMATVQTAYNNVDFSPGTAKFDNAQQSIQRFSETTATNFSDAAAVYAQGARFIDEAGNRLSPDKLDQYTDAVLRLSKVSSDHLSPVEIGQQTDILAKLFGTSDFGKMASEISALSGMHNQGEGPGLDAAVSIGQVGANIGVSQEQALALGNFLADLGLGGQMGGSSIGRLLQRMDIGSANALDPEQSFSQFKKHREASEKLDDLQDELTVAEERRQAMFGQHGLKTRFKRDPAALTEADDRIAKLKREIADQQTDIAHLDDTSTSKAGGPANVSAMADLLGEDKSTFAQQFQSDPVSALLAWAQRVGQLPANQQLGAITKAFGSRGGMVNVRDQRIIEALANPDRQGSLQSYLATALDQASNPTDLATRSAIPLGTTSAKVTDVSNAAFGTAAAAGNGPREAIDALASKVLDNTSKLDDLNKVLAGSALAGTIATGVASGVAAAAPMIITKLLTGGGGAAAGAGGVAASGVSGAGGALGTAATVGGVAIAAVTPFALAQMWKDQHPDSSIVQIDSAGQALSQRHAIGADTSNNEPHQINVGGVNVNVPGNAPPWEMVKNDVIREIAAAWDHAVSSQPVSSVLGGNLNTNGQGPR